MPRGHGKTFSSADKIVDRRSFALSRRSSVHSNYRFPLKESQMVVPVLRNCEERRIVLSFLTLDDHMWRLLVPFTSFVQGPELRSQQGSQDQVNTDVSDSLNSSYPQPAIFIQFDLKEQSLSSEEKPVFSSASLKTVTDYISSSPDVLGEPPRQNRNKFIKNTLSNSLGTASQESRLGCGSDCLALSASLDINSKVDKPVKLSSRNKGKKKRKQCKKSLHKKTLNKPEKMGEYIKCDASESENSVSGDPICLAASGSNLSLVVSCSNLPVEGSSVEVLEQLDIECNGKDCSGRLSSSVGGLLDKDINDFRKPTCVPYEFTDNTSKVSVDVATSISNKSYETSLSTSSKNNAEIDLSEDSLDDCGTQCSITNDSEFDSSTNTTTLISRDVSIEGEKYAHHDNDLSSRCSVSCFHWQNDVLDTDSTAERLLDSSQASSSDDFHPVIRAKRGRLARKLSGISNGMQRFSNTHLHRCLENDKKHSVWQKVEKPRTSELTYKKKNDKTISRDVNISLNCMETKVKSKQPIELKQNKNGKPFSTMDGRSTCTYLEKLRRKPSLDTEREIQSACHTSINSINVPSKIEVIKKEKLGTAVEFTKTSQRTDSMNSSLRETMNSQSSISPQETIDDTICSILHNTTLSRNVPSNSSVVNLNSNHSYVDTQFHGNILPSVDMNKDPFICTMNEGIRHMRVEMESAHLESSKTKNNFGSLVQKCLPMPRQELMITRSQVVNPEDSIVYEPVSSSPILGFTDKLLTSNCHEVGSLSTSETQCFSHRSSHMGCSSYEETNLPKKFDSQPYTSSPDFPSPSGCQFSHKMGNQHFPCTTDLSKISDAVDGSYKLFVAAEDIHRATGGPLAEFEKVLCSASPLIETGCINMCSTCTQNQIIRESLSFHQVPNISLNNLWKWYEKPGSYGLEVKVDDLFSSNRSRAGLSKSSAYFVPYLSAVQLFSRSGSSLYHPNNDTEGDLMETCEVCKTSKSLTSLASLPIFSKLLPRPHGKVDSGTAKLSLLGKSEESNKPIFCEQLADELLFEYFDSDQPQQRRPLFDKIQELIRGDPLSNCHFFGDPSKLGCLNLKELHPASWYAVAWYPIYRIPDGSFRAAFLTYHSLGHFVSRSTSSITEGCISSLISPVVGLQSYNAKGECWFEPKNMNFSAVPTDAALSENPSEILKGRLQSLEKTASAMSRATVRKGNLESTNRHPDYEFFLSRSR